MTAVRWGVRLVAFYLLLQGVALAQVTTADIVGRVTDSTGAVLPGATVTITNEGTGDMRSAPTTASGDFAFNILPIGTYAVKVELQGFGTQNTRLILSAGDRARFDAKLSLGQVEENITVTAQVSVLQTDTSTVGSLINLKEVQDLPVNGRNFIRLIQGLPGANEGLPNSLASGTRPDDRRQTSADLDQRRGRQPEQPDDRRHGQQRARHRDHRREAVASTRSPRSRSRRATTPPKPAARRAASSTSSPSRAPTRSRAPPSSSIATIVSTARNYFVGDQAAAQAASVRRQPWRPDPDRPDVFLRRLRGLLAGPGGHQSGDAADGPDAGRGFLRALRAHLRSAHDAADAVPRQSDSQPAVSIRSRCSTWRCCRRTRRRHPRQQLLEHHASHAGQLDGRRPHRPPIQRNNQSFFARYSFNNVDTFTPSACHATLDGIDRAAAAGRRSRARTTPRRTASQVNYMRVFSPTMIVGDQGRLPQVQHPVAAAELRIEPESDVRHCPA